jgi:hypothetical protein
MSDLWTHLSQHILACYVGQGQAVLMLRGLFLCHDNGMIAWCSGGCVVWVIVCSNH